MKSGFVALIGSTNAGKSTLINTILGERVAIVSPKPQTTRENIIGVYNEEECQIVFIDTPGIHKSNSRLSDYMEMCVETAAQSVSVIVLMIDSSKLLRSRDVSMIEKYAELGLPLIVALSKIDLIKKEQLILMLEKLNRMENISAVVPLSAKRKMNLDAFISEIKKYLTDEVMFYGEDVLTDKSEKYMVAEIIREKILYRYNDEIPHGVSVVLNKFEYNEGSDVYEIDADVICERPGHKSIIIGKQGQALKDVGTTARQSLEKFLEKKVFLTLWARVKEDWRNNPNLLAAFGYDNPEK